MAVCLWHTADIPEYSAGRSLVLAPLTSDRPRSYLCPILSKVLVKCLAVYNLAPLWPCILGTAMDERVEAVLADVLALEGEDPNVIRDGVRGALADYQQLFRAQE